MYSVKPLENGLSPRLSAVTYRSRTRVNKTIVGSQTQRRVAHTRRGGFQLENPKTKWNFSSSPTVSSRNVRVSAGPFGSKQTDKAAESTEKEQVQMTKKESDFDKLIRRLRNAKPKAEQQISYAQLLEYLQNKRVIRLGIYDEGKEAIVEVCIPGYEDEPEELMERQTFNCLLPGDYHEECLKLAKEANSKTAGPERGTVVCNFEYVDPASVAPPIIGQMSTQVFPIIGFWLFQQGLELAQWLRRGRQAKKSARRKLAEMLGASLAQEYAAEDAANDLGIRFDDVAGIDHAVYMFQEIIDMMRGDPRYSERGADPPKGVLLEGPPGTGKTMLAKAVASEGGIPFFSANGSEFVEMYVGVAAARVRDLFARARANQPAIIFIDEIDTIGRARGGGGPGADTSEREQGLMQLLVEMDGFSSKEEKVLVIGATNLRETLDPALVRSGRFDRVVHLGLPNEENRLYILAVHARGKQISGDGDEDYDDNALLRRTAALTVGFSGAELANLLNEAAILAVRRGKDQIQMDEIEVAIEKMKMGLPRPPLPLSTEKQKLAYVEAGRAILYTVTKGAPEVLQVSVAPRGSHPSRVTLVPQDAEKTASLNTLQDYLDAVATAMAGRATEETVFGRMGVTLATSTELAVASEVAFRLVAHSGQHPEFHRLLLDDEELHNFPKTRLKVDNCVSECIDYSYSKALGLVRKYRPAIDKLVEELLEKDTVYGSRIQQILATEPVNMISESWRGESVPYRGKDGRPSPSPTEGEVVFSGKGKVGTVSYNDVARVMEVHFSEALAKIEAKYDAALEAEAEKAEAEWKDETEGTSDVSLEKYAEVIQDMWDGETVEPWSQDQWTPPKDFWSPDSEFFLEKDEYMGFPATSGGVEFYGRGKVGWVYFNIPAPVIVSEYDKKDYDFSPVVARPPPTGFPSQGFQRLSFGKKTGSNSTHVDTTARVDESLDVDTRSDQEEDPVAVKSIDEDSNHESTATEETDTDPNNGHGKEGEVSTVL